MIGPERTIAAQATAAGQGAIAIIRMSGGRCMKILAKCTRPSLAERLHPRRAVLTHLLDAEGTPIDQVLLTYFPAPASYTGEDTVEISCHGGMLVTERLLKRLYRCGASPAEPGEFTKRAFLNGRMDLTQAEAVMDVISAGSDLALRAAQSQLDGNIGARVDELKDELVHVLAHVEAYIDFPDEDISPDTASALLSRLGNAEEQLSGLLGSAAAGRLLREGIRTAIAGPPNVGKSSLLNTLLGYERAIVSNIAGTTRDTVEESIQIAGLALRLIDTAGVRESSDVIEQAGILRTNRALETADLVLEVMDASLPRTAPLLAENRNTPSLLILNKCDLGIHSDWQEVSGIHFSCSTGEGRKELEEAIIRTFASQLPCEAGSSLVAINARHQHELGLCLEHVHLASESISRQESPEFTALELREALAHLGEITGAVDTEDVLGAIFSSFCLGK